MKKYGIIAGLLTVSIHLAALMGIQDEIYKIYSSIIFPAIRILYDWTLGLLPFATIYIVFFGLTFFLIYKGAKSFTAKNTGSTYFHKFIFLINSAGWIYFLFYFLWAFNYYRPSLNAKLSLPEIKIDTFILTNELKVVTEIINKIRPNLNISSNEPDYRSGWRGLEDTIRKSQVDLLKSWGDHVSGRVRIRSLFPKGLLLRISTAGVYIPFSCEGHVDPGLNVIQWPFTIAHEMAHGYGYTDEGECNFIGFLTCIQSKDRHIQYSGWLAYWRYLYVQVKESLPVAAEEAYCNLNSGVVDDLRAIKNDINKYPDLFPWVRNFIYEFYLKSHGIDEGLNSYNGIIALVLSWNKMNQKM